MKPRLPTPEERKLWRESNRFTDRRRTDEDPLEEVGEVAAPDVNSPPQSSAAPAPQRPRSLSPLPVLGARAATRHFKPYPLEATLDLHGMSKLDAYRHVQQFIAQQHHARRRHIAIITGKGRGSEAGVLRSHLPHWLNEPLLRPWISALAHAKPEKGGNGVLHVLLKHLS
jgi:DNA-nicking Smr family endonuclease